MFNRLLSPFFTLPRQRASPVTDSIDKSIPPRGLTIHGKRERLIEKCSVGPIDEERTSTRINEIRKRLAPFEKATARSKILAKQISTALAYIAICGVDVDFSSQDVIEGLVSIRKVTNPPGLVAVAAAGKPEGSDYFTVARYSPSIRAEMLIGVGESSSDFPMQSWVNLAYNTAVMFKLRGHFALYSPASASASWDTISGIRDHSVLFCVLDDVPRQIGLSRKATVISAADVEWVSKHYMDVFDLRNEEKSARFGLAFNVYYTWNHTSDSRVALANLWIGLEALFGKQTDRRVTDALCGRIAAWIGIDKKTIADLYRRRCDAVHGRPVDARSMPQSIRDTESLLRRSLVNSIETNQRTLENWR